MATYRPGSAGTKITTNTGASISAGVTAAAGEVILCVVDTRISDATLTNLNGWTLIGRSPTPVSNNASAFLLGRTAAGAESSWSSPITSSSSNQQIQVAGVIQGVDLAGTTFDAAHLSTTNGTSTASNSVPSVSGGVNGGIVFACMGISRGMTGVTWTTFNEATDVATGTGNTNFELTSAYIELSSSGSTPTGSVAPATTGGNYAVIVAAIDPPAAAGSQFVPRRDPARGLYMR